MMHGYLAFDKNDRLLAPFRTWRNTNTARAAAQLTELFHFNVPMRWSVSQYYESVLDGLAHVKDISFLTPQPNC
jgi:sugar (pentulose or hexulose) kinase